MDQQRQTVLKLNQLQSLVTPTTQTCPGASCPKIGCDKHYLVNQCLYGAERVGNIKDTTSSTNSKKKQYQCSMCVKSFAQSISLKRHIRTHTGEKPFQCKECSRRFTNSSHLTTHMRTHTGERPFQCDMCGKKFSQHSGLHVHIRTHTGDKPYKCEICKKGFLDRSALKRHGATHDRDPKQRRGSKTNSRKQARPAERAANSGPSEIDDLAALLCVKTLQDYFTVIGLCYKQDTLSRHAINTSLLHTLASKLVAIKEEKMDVDEMPSTSYHMTSSPHHMTSSPHHMTSSPYHMTSSVPQIHLKPSPRSSPSPIHMTGIPSPPATPGHYYPSPCDVTTPSRDVTTTPSKDYTLTGSMALSPAFSLSSNSAEPCCPGSCEANVPFTCALSAVRSLSDSKDKDMFNNSNNL